MLFPVSFDDWLIYELLVNDMGIVTFKRISAEINITSRHLVANENKFDRTSAVAYADTSRHDVFALYVTTLLQLQKLGGVK